MNTPVKTFPLPSSLKVVPGTERAQAGYPYTIQFGAGDDERFWFYNSMHFPEPMSAFDMVTAEAAYCALGSANTRVHCLPTTLGIDHRIINGRVYIGGNAVTDPAEIARRTAEFQKRAFYYYENWERLYEQWREKMLALIRASQALPKPAVLTDETESTFWVMKLIDSTTAVKVPVVKGLETKDKIEILSPVFKRSDRILVTGNYGLPDTAKVKVDEPGS